MAKMPASLLAHFQQLDAKKSGAKANPLAGVAPKAGTNKTAPGTKKPKKGKSKMQGVPLTAGQKRLPIGLQNAILRSRGFNV